MSDAMTDERLAEIEQEIVCQTELEGCRVCLCGELREACKEIRLLREERLDLLAKAGIKLAEVEKQNANLRKVLEAARLFLYSEDESEDFDMENCERNYENLEQVVDEHLVRIRGLKLRSLRKALRELDEQNHE